jgi:hypothetical protein
LENNYCSWNKNKIIESLEYCGCEKKMDCNKCHGWFENKYHPDNLLKSSDTDDEKNKINHDVIKMNFAKKSYRTILTAYKEMPKEEFHELISNP